MKLRKQPQGRDVNTGMKSAVIWKIEFRLGEQVNILWELGIQVKLIYV